jgi:hypothetical protein
MDIRPWPQGSDGLRNVVVEGSSSSDGIREKAVVSGTPWPAEAVQTVDSDSLLVQTQTDKISVGPDTQV